MSHDGERDRSVERQMFIRSLNMGNLVGTFSKHLASRMRETMFPAGTVIYRRGDVASHIYWVTRGDVALTLEGSDPWTLLPPSVVGVFDVIQDRARERTATALTDVEALALSAEDYLDILEDNVDVYRGAVRGSTKGLHVLGLSIAAAGGSEALERESPFPSSTATIMPVPARPLHLVERTLVLHETPLFRAMRVQAVTLLASVAEELRFSEAEVIFRRGEPSSALLVVARGLIHVTRDDPRVEIRAAAGTLLGSYSSLGHDTHEFDAAALAPSSVLRIAKDDLFDLLEDHFEVTRSLLGYLTSERERLLAMPHGRVKPGASMPPIPSETFAGGRAGVGRRPMRG